MLIYSGWYGLGRMFIEGLRTDSLMIGTLRVSQVLAGLLFVASLITWIVVRSRIKAQHDPEYLKLYALTDEGKEVIAGTYYKRLEEERKAAKAAKMAEKEAAAETAESEETETETAETGAETAGSEESAAETAEETSGEDEPEADKEEKEEKTEE